MTLFKVFYGTEAEMNQVAVKESYAYILEENDCMYVDFNNARHKLNAGYAEKLRKFNAAGAVEIEIDPEELVLNSDIIDIEHGGTGGKTATEARTNLDVYSKTEVTDNIKTATDKVTSKAYPATLSVGAWTLDGEVYKMSYLIETLKCGADGTVPPIITYTSNLEEYSKIEKATATPGFGVTFEIKEKPTDSIGIIIVDNC